MADLPRLRRGDVVEGQGGCRAVVWRQVWRREFDDRGVAGPRRRVGFRLWSLELGIPLNRVWHERDVEAGTLRLTGERHEFAEVEDDDGEAEQELPGSEGERAGAANGGD